MLGKIYIIRNQLNNQVYIGSTMLSLKRRFRLHYNSMYDNKKKNPMYRDMWRNFKLFNISLLCEYEMEERKELFAVEKDWIKYYVENNYDCYNIRY